MGHLGHLKESYGELAKRLGASSIALPEPHDAEAREGCQDILEILYTPDAAKLASHMPVAPCDLHALPKRLQRPVVPLKMQLDAMADKGLVQVMSRCGRFALQAVDDPTGH